MKHFTYIFIFSALSTLSCSEKSQPDNPDPVKIQLGEMMLVSNEGNFQWGNATAGLINVSTNQIWEDAFKVQNGKPLGDVLQSAIPVGSEWWLVMNNSGKIETVSTTDFKSTGTITGFTSPRYALQISANQVLVSDLHANGISVIDISTKTKTGFISIHGWTEEMAQIGDQVWVVSKAKPLIYIVNTSSLILVDSLPLPGKGTSIQKGPSGKLWIGFAGDQNEPGGILLVEAATKSILNTWNTTDNNQTPDRFEISTTGDSLFYINQGAYLLSATQNGFTPIEVVSKTDGNWYGMGFDRKRQTLYLSDAKDYVQKSTVRILELKTGLRKPDLKVGVTSGHFYFF